jgi:hypothetical protein
MSSGFDSISNELDNLLYKMNEKKWFCDFSRCSGWIFPRHLVSVGGIVVEVEALGGLPEHGKADLQGKLCIPSSVEKLGKWCFSRCESLSTVTFESSSKFSSIEQSAFGDCSSLSSICIPSSVEKLDKDVFYGVNLGEISVAKGNRQFKVWGSSFWIWHVFRPRSILGMG